MLTAEQNRMLTSVAAGTPIGSLMRRYWIPVLLSSELPDRDGDPERIRVLGEDLIAFRDSDGAVGLLGANCPHRGAPLYFGRNERGGLRCMYHGWKFDTNGRCMDMPNVPPQSDFKDRVRHLSYPCRELGGVIWAYLGPPKSVPDLPAFDWLRLDPAHVVMSKQLLFCNYLQGMEGDFDPSHISFLHSTLDAFMEFERHTVGHAADAAPEPDGELTPELEDIYWKLDPRPSIMVLATEYGLFTGARRGAGRGSYYYRFNHFVMPFYAGIPRDVGSAAQVNAWVPIDDEKTMVWRITYRPEQRFTDDERREQLSGRDAHVAPTGYLAPTAEPGSRWIPALNRSNDYGLDRQRQRTLAYSGVPGVWAQDRACTEGMGAIIDRTQERLASSDVGITQLRRILLRAARALSENGIDPPGVRQTPTVPAIPTGIYSRELSWPDIARRVRDLAFPPEASSTGSNKRTSKKSKVTAG